MTASRPSELEDGVIETLFDHLSQAVDRAGPEGETLFLARLALLMAEQIGDPVRVSALIAAAEARIDD
ncbi:hypothetical protein [Govanella unica]|uniref:DUF2783 domain-containing protein n=1 Tax=Govanella unica TaxID=2975056 RepID=A0A9X3TVH4_9PROT|nr:hypothetical protein [Govania unica]MDA5192458.1 DUF2783 domain-containing protein [Govania unica]